jgi:rubrerythrin
LSENTLLNFIRQQIAVENEIVDSLNEALRSISNPSVRGVLKGISLDSLKHAEMYDAALKLLTTTQQALSQEHLDKQRSLVEKHIRMEAELIKKISDILPTVENEKVRLLLNAILADEKRHHQLLKEVLEVKSSPRLNKAGSFQLFLPVMLQPSGPFCRKHSHEVQRLE